MQLKSLWCIEQIDPLKMTSSLGAAKILVDCP